MRPPICPSGPGATATNSAMLACMGRIDDYWKEPWYAPVIHSHEGPDDPLSEAIRERMQHPKAERHLEAFTQSDLFRLSKELVFRLEDGEPAFQYVCWTLELKTFELALAPSWSTVSLETDEDVKRVLAFAMLYSVPVVPDSEADAVPLEAYERDLLANGLTITDEGEETRLIYEPFRGVDLEGTETLDVVRGRQVPSLTELRVALRSADRELKARVEAGRVLAGLRLGIGDLEALLERKERNENDLQRCLTRHPVLFGTEYAELLPKHRLGGDYEMDYALLRPGGLADLVEIEASTHALFTQDGHVTGALAQAEQQVLDWLGWIEQHGSLAHRDLPDLQRPRGYVVIGRSQSLGEAGRRRLLQRNQLFGGTLQLLTFDDLLLRARTLLAHLEGLAPER